MRTTDKEPNIPWTDPEVERCKTLWISGISCAKVARTLNAEFPHAVRTRNAVIGVISRARLKRECPEASIKAGAHMGGMIRRMQRKAVQKAKDAAPTPPREKAFMRTPTTVPFLAREFDQCAWPVELGGSEHLCCGAPISGRGSYCPVHTRLAFRKAA